MPSRATPGAAGLDLFAAHSVRVPAGSRALVNTDLRCSMDRRYYGRIASRSGLAYKHGLLALEGVIDADYTGILGVLLFNMGQQDVIIEQGQRIAQWITCLNADPPAEDVGPQLMMHRGSCGWGSTGRF